MSQLEDRIDEFRRLGAEVYGISVDSHFAAGAWARERGLSYPMLGDMDRVAIHAYGVALPEMAGYHDVANRAIFIIDQSGSIVYKDVVPHPSDIPSAEAALEKLREIVHG